MFGIDLKEVIRYRDLGQILLKQGEMAHKVVHSSSGTTRWMTGGKIVIDGEHLLL
jgi:hypothetical protein